MRDQAEFDVIVYGATGFTGRLVAEYMENQYGRTLNWAMAGRSAEKLAAVRDEIKSPAPLVVADAGDAQSARHGQSRKAGTTVGSQLYGNDIVAVMLNCTDYVDRPVNRADARDNRGI